MNNKKTKSLPVDEQLFRSFEKIHKDSEDYVKFWRIKLNKGQKIPVFFILENEKIHSMGLSSLYRYPSRMSIFDAIPKELKNPENLGKENKIEMDLAECMFGFAFGGEALKGRVQFGHAMAVGNPIPLTDKVFVSSTPHPSFYPLYVKNGNDWNHASRINGRKRYPVRNQADYKNEGTDNMSQVASMLNAGTSFTEYIRFNNLRPIELGALLSALTFHGMHSQCCHNLGFGKPFGYGKVKVSKLNLQTSEGNDVAKYMQAFENAMITAIPDWLHSDQMVELLSMAKGVPSGKNAEFQYLRMSTNQKENEFKQVKDNGECLKSFSHISSVKVVGESVSGKEFSDFADKEAEMREMMLQEQKEKDAARKDKNLQNLNLSFLDEENRFKKGWDALKTRLKNCGLEFNSSVMEFISEQDKQRLVNFVKRMFARKDSKWGKNNNDYAKDFARKEVEAFIGKKPEDL